MVEGLPEVVPAETTEVTVQAASEAAGVPQSPAAPCETPIAEQASTEEASEPETSVPVADPARSDPRAHGPSVVLIIDPDAVSRRFAEISFGRRGDLRVKTAPDGASALELVAADPVHLILSETEFADMSGLQLLRRFEKEGRLRGVPFVFLSADGRATTKSASFAAGADDFLVKPCDGEVLSTRVRALIARERRVAAERQTSSYGLAGRFSELACADLLMLLEYGQRSGTVFVACDDGTGTLSVNEGQVVHAVFGTLVGPRALAEVAARTEGQFEFTPGACPIARTHWTIVAETSVPPPVSHSVTARYFAPQVEEPTIVVGLAPTPVTKVAPAVPPRADTSPARVPAFVPDPGSASQIEQAILDGFALGDLTSFTAQALARWSAATPVRERFHVVLAADLKQGASAMLALAGSPTEDWILRSLGARMAAVGLEFYLRRARLLDVVLLDIREPARLRESLRRVPSVVIVAPPAGDPLALGVRARIEIVDLVSQLSPPAVLVLGNPSLKKAFRALGTETVIRCLPSALGEDGADLRAVLAEGIRLCAGATR